MRIRQLIVSYSPLHFEATYALPSKNRQGIKSVNLVGTPLICTWNRYGFHNRTLAWYCNASNIFRVAFTPLRISKIACLSFTCMYREPVSIPIADFFFACSRLASQYARARRSAHTFPPRTIEFERMLDAGRDHGKAENMARCYTGCS